MLQQMRLIRVMMMVFLLCSQPSVSQTEEVADALSPAQLQALRQQLFGGMDVSFGGYVRLEGTTEQHFDLGVAPAATNSFYDLRGYLESKIGRGPAALHLDVDVAGNDFSDPEGGVLGNGQDATATPGGPAVVRQNGFDLRVRHLYLSYDGYVHAAAGRMAAKIGHGIVINTIRDSAKLAKVFGPLKLVAILVKGGETQPNNNLNAASDNDLDAYGGVAVYHFDAHNRVQLVAMKQVDTTFDNRLPEKLLVDLNGDFQSGAWTYAFETAWLGGYTPRDVTLARRKNRAWMGYVRGQYHVARARLDLGLALGMGSGENRKSGTQRNFQSFFMNAIGFHLANIYGNDIYSYDAFLPGSGAGRDGNNAGAGFANTSFVQLSAKLTPFAGLPESTLETSFTYLRATRSQTVGEGVLLGKLDGFTAAPGVLQSSRDIGWEVDVNMMHPLSANMHTYLRSGWFVPGAIFGSARRTAFKLQGGVEFSF